MSRKCLACGKEFEPVRCTQKYCSAACRKYAYRHGIENETYRRTSGNGKVLREFTCLQCGKKVQIRDSRDRRMKFCSQHCERWYWKQNKKAKSVPVERMFVCRQCGKVVTVRNSGDRRRIFCCAACCRQWFINHQRDRHGVHAP